MPNETKVIRDFIYMDVERLNSLYSQAFGGVIPQIVKSRTHEGTSEERQENVSEKTPQEMLTQRLVTEARHETKNVILYDYLYTQFGDGVAESILTPDNITQDNYRALLSEAFLIKVQGPAEIEDYQRFVTTSEKFSTITADIAWVSHSEAIKVAIELLEIKIQEFQEQVKSLTGGERTRVNSQIADAQRELKQYKDTENLKSRLAAQMGMGVDANMMESVARLFRYFTPDNFEVTISPDVGSKKIVYRGILDKRLLRVQPEYLRVLYEGSVNKKWTMVGEITHFPETSQSQEETVPPSEIVQDEQTSKDGDAAMKDVTRNVFKSFAAMEGRFFESKKRVELRIRPLAIYQEVTIKVTV